MKRFGLEDEYVKWNSSTNSNDDHFYASFFPLVIYRLVLSRAMGTRYGEMVDLQMEIPMIYIHTLSNVIVFFHFFFYRKNVYGVRRVFELGSLLMTTMRKKTKFQSFSDHNVRVSKANEIDIYGAFDSNSKLRNRALANNQFRSDGISSKRTHHKCCQKSRIKYIHEYG